jgi:translocation and assembly module TamA
MSLKIAAFMPARRLTIVLLTAVLAGASFASVAADPQSYRVEFAASGVSAIDATLRPSSELASLRSTAPVGPFGLIARAEGDIERLETVLQSFGYYQGKVEISIDGHALNDSALGDLLTALPKGTEARVRISTRLGPLYQLGKVEIDGELPAELRATLGLVSGAPAVASEVLTGGVRLLNALENSGYAFARVDPPVAYELPAEGLLNVSFHVTAGPRVKVGRIRIEGLKRVHERLVRRRLLLHSGEGYDASRIEKARKDLLLLGVFATISVKVGEAADASGAVPVTFQVRERARHAVTLNAAYSSDLGGSGGVTWTDRNVLGNAEQLTFNASVIDLGGSSTTGVGYDTGGKLLFPEFGHRDQSLQVSVEALKQFLQAYDQTAWKNGLTLTRKLSTVWSASVGLTLTREQILQQAATLDYTLVALPLTLNYDSTDLASPLDDPRHGLRAAFNLVPTRSLGTPNATYVVTQVTASTYLDSQRLGLEDPGRGILALRGLAGLAKGAGEFSLPPDQRFYGGGSGTIRGYAYQSVGPLFNGDASTPIGGTSITAAKVEFRQRLGKDWGAAWFIDGGQVGADPKLFTGALQVGVGTGVRYYTPIGPIRLDLGVPVDRRRGDDRFEVYIGLGQAF